MVMKKILEEKLKFIKRNSGRGKGNGGVSSAYFFNYLFNKKPKRLYR